MTDHPPPLVYTLTVDHLRPFAAAWQSLVDDVAAACASMERLTRELQRPAPRGTSAPARRAERRRLRMTLPAHHR